MQHVHRIRGVWLVQRDGIRNDLLLLPEGVVGNAAAPAGDSLHADPQQHGENCRRCGGVANAHLSHAHGVRFRLHGKLCPGENGLNGLLPGHGGPPYDILGAEGDLFIQDLGLLDDGVDAHIADRNPGAEVLGKHRRAGLSPGQVDGLHQRHRLGRTGNPLLHNAVVCSENQQMGFVHGIVDLSGNARQLNGQFFQPPQALRGLGKGGLPLPGGSHGLLRKGGNGCK